MTLFARIISYLLHPLLMPTIGIFIIFNTDTYLSFLRDDYQHLLYLVVFLTTCILPLITIPLFLYWKFIKSLEMHNKNERFFPMLIILIFNFSTYYLFTKLPMPSPIRMYILAITIAVFLTMIITVRWKISSHMVGIGGMSGLIAAFSVLYMVDLQIVFMASLLVAGLIGFARLHLNAHSPAQVYAGFFLGFFSEFLILIFFTAKIHLH